jgi:excisionase family DNA binding protein
MTSLLDEDSLSVAEAAARLKVHKSTIWRWIDSGRLHAYRIGERRVRLKKADIEGLITPARVIGREGGDMANHQQAPAVRRLTEEEQLGAGSLAVRDHQYPSPAYNSERTFVR